MMSITSCSDFRKAVGKEKVIPDEFSVAITPSLVVPPGYNIDPEKLLNNNSAQFDKNFNLGKKIEIEETSNISTFNELFNNNVPKNIRKIIDEETLGISLSERRGIDILLGQIPKTGIVIDSKKEALRIQENKSLNKKVTSTPSPAVDINSGKPLLIK